MGGTGGTSGFPWQSAISGLMQLAGAGITANRGVLGPILMMGGQMMAKNQEFKRLSAFATQAAGSIQGTPEAEQIQGLLRSGQADLPQIRNLLAAGQETKATMAIPSLFEPVATQEQAPTGRTRTETLRALPRSPATSAPIIEPVKREELARLGWPGPPGSMKRQVGTSATAQAGVETTEVPETETVTRERPALLKEQLDRASKIEDPATKAIAYRYIMQRYSPELEEKQRERVGQQRARENLLSVLARPPGERIELAPGVPARTTRQEFGIPGAGQGVTAPPAAPPAATAFGTQRPTLPPSAAPAIPPTAEATAQTPAQPPVYEDVPGELTQETMRERLMAKSPEERGFLMQLIDFKNLPTESSRRKEALQRQNLVAAYMRQGMSRDLAVQQAQLATSGLPAGQIPDLRTVDAQTLLATLASKYDFGNPAQVKAAVLEANLLGKPELAEEIEKQAKNLMALGETAGKNLTQNVRQELTRMGFTNPSEWTPTRIGQAADIVNRRSLGQRVAGAEASVVSTRTMAELAKLEDQDVLLQRAQTLATRMKDLFAKIRQHGDAPRLLKMPLQAIARLAGMGEYAAVLAEFETLNGQFATVAQAAENITGNRLAVQNVNRALAFHANPSESFAVQMARIGQLDRVLAENRQIMKEARHRVIGRHQKVLEQLGLPSAFGAMEESSGGGGTTDEGDIAEPAEATQ